MHLSASYLSSVVMMNPSALTDAMLLSNLAILSIFKVRFYDELKIPSFT